MCLIAGVRHNVDLSLELALSLPGDSGDSSQEPSCPYQVARKYLKSSVPGPISSKGLLRDFWKTPQCSNESCWREGRGRRKRRRERWAVVVVVFCSLCIFPAIKCRPHYDWCCCLTPWHKEHCLGNTPSSHRRAKEHFCNSENHWEFCCCFPRII